MVSRPLGFVVRCGVLVSAVLFWEACAKQGQQPSPSTTTTTTRGVVSMPIPVDTFKQWRHVKTMVIVDSLHPLYDPFGGVHHVYANGRAQAALEPCEDRRFPQGAILAFLLYQAHLEEGAIHEGNLKLYAFMVKDTSQFQQTAGWGFYAYDARGRAIATPNNAQSCFSCHSAVAHQDYVFSCLTN